MRRVIAFACEGETLVASLDEAAGTTGLLVVSGGNEVRAGTHRGMARLAARVAAAGVPALRYDRRGVGDASGTNGGSRSGAPDLAAAAAAFRRETGIARVVGLGNCDGASALALHGRDAGLDAAILTNPWLRDEDDGLPPRAAIGRRFAEIARRPAEWPRLLGKLSPATVARLLRLGGKLARRDRDPPEADAILAAIRAWGSDATILLADRDATAAVFAARATGLAAERIATASHSFADAENELAEAVLRVLRKSPAPRSG
jgi:alpha-beta hydrolase superfamily lysophospholipase